MTIVMAGFSWVDDVVRKSKLIYPPNVEYMRVLMYGIKRSFGFLSIFVALSAMRVVCGSVTSLRLCWQCKWCGAK